MKRAYSSLVERIASLPYYQRAISNVNIPTDWHNAIMGHLKRNLQPLSRYLSFWIESVYT